MRRRTAVAAALAAAAAAVWPAAAQAHGLVGRADLPIPSWLFGWGASIVLVVSFVALATLWPKPRLERAEERPLFRIPAWVDPLWPHVEVDPDEPFAANVLLLGGTVVAGQWPRTNERLRRAGVDLRAVDASELAKAEGGVTCCSIIV